MKEYSFKLDLVKEQFSDEKDQLQSMIFRDDQRLNLRNELRDVLQEKANMSGEIENFLLKQEYLRGQLTILQTLLAADEAAMHRLLDLITQEKGE